MKLPMMLLWKKHLRPVALPMKGQRGNAPVMHLLCGIPCYNAYKRSNVHYRLKMAHAPLSLCSLQAVPQYFTGPFPRFASVRPAGKSFMVTSHAHMRSRGRRFILITPGDSWGGARFLVSDVLAKDIPGTKYVTVEVKSVAITAC